MIKTSRLVQAYLHKELQALFTYMPPVKEDKSVCCAMFLHDSYAIFQRLTLNTNKLHTEPMCKMCDVLCVQLHGHKTNQQCQSTEKLSLHAQQVFTNTATSA